MTTITPDDDSAHPLPIDGTLDLHHFAPRDVPEVVRAYIDACLERGIRELRIVHGKGKGVQKELVHRVLASHPSVATFRHEGGSGGGWGATVVDLKNPLSRPGEHEQ